MNYLTAPNLLHAAGFTMRFSLIAIIAVLAGLAGFAALARNRQRLETSEWSVSSSNLGLQARVGGEEVKGEVVLTNTGGVPIPFHVERTCSCTSVQPDSGIVSPGEPFAIRLSIRAPSLAGSTSSAHVRFIPESPGQARTLSCQVSAEYPSSFSSSPRIVDFGDLSMTAAALAVQRMTIKVSSATAEALDFGSLKPRSASGKFQVSIHERRPQDILIEVKMAGNLEVGKSFSSIEFGDPRGGGGISIPVQANIVGNLTVTPSLIRLVASEQGFQPATILVLDRSREPRSSKDDLRIVEDDRGLALRRLETTGGGRQKYQKYQLIVREPEIFRRDQPSEIHLTAGDRGESCCIKLLVESSVN